MERPLTLSVVIASFRSEELLRQAIARLEPQCIALDAELIVARAADEWTIDDPRRVNYRAVRCPRNSTVPELRGAGIAIGSGEWVLVTEDNCVVATDWVERMQRMFGTGALVVGGTMGNAHPESAVAAAAFYVEYGYFGQARRDLGTGASPFLTGANVAYHCSIAGEVASWAASGAWEGDIHHRLKARGVPFALAFDAVAFQNTRCGVREFCSDRFAHGNTYALTRSRAWGRLRCTLAALATPILPFMLTWRAWRNSGKTDAATFVRALPCTLLFASAWALGEAYGYWPSNEQPAISAPCT